MNSEHLEEDIVNVKEKMRWPDCLTVYGDYIKLKIHESHSDLNLDTESSYSSTYDGFYSYLAISEKIEGCPQDSSKIKRSEDLLKIEIEKGEETITVYKRSLRKTVEDAVKEANEKSGFKFKVFYARE